MPGETSPTSSRSRVPPLDASKRPPDPGSAGEGATRVAEELALEERLGDGAAVDRDERTRGADRRRG